MKMLHLQGHMITQSKGGISKASAFVQFYLQASEVVLLHPFNYLSPFWDEKSSVPLSRNHARSSYERMP